MFCVKAIGCLVFLLQVLTTTNSQQTRLVNGSSELEGRLEVLCDVRWLTVCQNNIDNDLANSLCRDLGFSDQNAEIVSPEVFGSGNPSTSTSTITCISDGQTGQMCNHAGLICRTAQCQDWDVNIEVTPAQVCQGQTWKDIQYCSPDFNSDIICRQAGYSSYGSFSVPYAIGNQRQLSTLRCLGNETHLSQCPQEPCDMGNSQASNITCKETCHLCNDMSSNIEVRKTGFSTLELHWSFRIATYQSFDYYIANCSSTTKQGEIPVNSIQVITSPTTSSVEITGVQFQYNYTCCVTARQKQHSDYVVCSSSLQLSRSSTDFVYTLGGVFFYLFLTLAVITIVLVAGIMIAFICSRRKRTFIKSRRRKKIAADLNKVFSQSTLSINEKGKKDNMEISTAVTAKHSTNTLTSDTKRLDELVKSLPAKVDKEKRQVEYSALVRIEKFSEKEEEKSVKVSPCVAYGAMPESVPGQTQSSQNADYRDLNESHKDESKITASQYYEDVP